MKTKFEITKSMGDYYSIIKIENGEKETVWGGDSAWEDCYDLSVAKDVLKELKTKKTKEQLLQFLQEL